MRHPLSIRDLLRRSAVLLTVALLLALCACSAVPAAVPAPEETSDAGLLPVMDEPEPPVTPQPDASPAQSLPQPEGELFFASSPDVAVYSQPSDSREFLLGAMKEGTVVTKLGEQDGFMHVQWGEGDVWCRSWYLRAQDPALEERRDAERLAALSSVSGYMPFTEPQECFTTASMLNCREQPNTDCAVLDQLPSGTKVTLYGQVHSFGLVRLENGRLCYCSTLYLAGGSLCAVYPGAVDLRALLPQAQFDLLFASPYNITGRALYPAVPLLEEHTARLLYAAYLAFLDDGYLLKIYDAYRPLSAQFALFDIVQDVHFIADPNTWGSWHQRGRAVDISLVDMATGEELEMPTPMHTFDTRAFRTRSDRWTEDARRNVDYMTRIMTEMGFGTIQTEWWHFEYTGEGNTLPLEIDYDTLTYRPASQYFN